MIVFHIKTFSYLFRFWMNVYFLVGFIIVLCFSPSFSLLEAQPVPYFRIREQKAYDLFRKSLLFYHTQRYGAAREFLYKSLAIYPHFNLARRYLGDAYYYTGNWFEALQEWETLIEASQNSYPLVEQRSQILRFQLGHTKAPEKYVFLQAFQPDSWPGYKFERPTDIALGTEGELYLSSMKSGNVIRFSPTGTALKKISGSFYNSLKTPLGSGVDENGRIYVSEYQKDQIRVFSDRGEDLFHFGEAGRRPGQFYGPTGIVVHGNTIFVADAGNRRVQKFSTDGKFLLEIGHNIGEKAPLHPTGLAIDRENILYVADRDGARILRFDLDGNYLGDILSEWVKKPRGLHVSDDRLIIADEESGVLFYELSKKRWSLLDNLQDEKGNAIKIVRPFSARINKTGGLYIADYGSNRLLLLVPLGMRISNLNCQIQRIDRSAFPQIGVFVSTSNRFGNSLQGLKRKNFLLYENDSLINVIKTDNIIPYNHRNTIAIVRENSPYYAENYNGYLSSTLNSILTSLRIADMVYVIQAGKDARVVYKGLERRRIMRLLKQRSDESVEPNIGKGIYEAITYLSKKLGPRSVVVLVSGKSYSNSFAQYSIQRLKQFSLSHHIPIQILSYEGERDTQKKEEIMASYSSIAYETKGRYFQAFNERSLTQFYDDLAKKKDRRYIITYGTNLNKRFTGRYVDLRLEINYLGTKGIGNSGYFVP